MELFVSAVSQGLIWGIMGLGLYISFRILNLPDMTTESSFTIGAATSSMLIIYFDVHPLIATLISFFAGMAAGAITGVLITRFNINPLLAGIITLTGIYSINLKLMGRANLGLNNFPTFKTVVSALNLPRNFDTILVGTLLVAFIIWIVSQFLQTDLGQALVATGDNEIMARSIGIDTNEMKMLGLMLANGLVAISGSLVAQDNGYADISMGTGTVVIGLAAIIIGEVVFRNVSLKLRLICVIYGSIIYRLLIMIVLFLKFDPDDFKLLSAIILAGVLAYPYLMQQKQIRDIQRKGINHG